MLDGIENRLEKVLQLSIVTAELYCFLRWNRQEGMVEREVVKGLMDRSLRLVFEEVAEYL